ncbi:MAG TPA: EamA family transporter [Candidatus Limnocylindria bacterium]
MTTDMRSRPASATLLAFAVFVLFGGANAVGVKFALVDLDPFWAAGVRFLLAGLLLFGYAIVTRRRLPRGERLLGTTLFGLFGVGLAYFFLYWGLQEAPAGTTMLMLATVPLLTLLLASLQRVERLRWLGLAGAVVASAGIVVVAGDQLRLDVPILSLAALLAGAASLAQSSVVAKRFPPGDPVPANAIGMTLGGLLLLAVAILTGERLGAPVAAEAWWAMAYLIGPGSVVVFILALYILARWTASATSYAFLLFPLVAVVLGALMLGEPVQPTFVIGGAIVLVGVYIGAVYRPRPTAEVVVPPEGALPD